MMISRRATENQLKMYSQRIKTNPINLEFSGFMAVDNLDLCQEYLAGHSSVLRAFNIPKVGSEESSWMHKKGSLVVIVRDQFSSQLVGGGRLEIASEGYDLPLSETMAILEPGFDTNKYFNPDKTVAELSGLWTERGGSIKGLSTTIVTMLNVCGRRMNLDVGTALCSPYSIKRFFSAGWSLVEDIGQNGYFEYPNSDYKSAFMTKEFQGRFSRGEREIFRTTNESRIHTSLETRTTGNYVFRFDLSALPIKVSL